MKKYAIGLVFLLIIQLAYAMPATILYRASVPVASQSPDDRKGVFSEALGKVLIKISGKDNILDNPVIKERLPNAENLVQEFGFSANKARGGTPYLLNVQFDKEGVNHLLQDASIPIWGQKRPLILAWVEFEGINKPAEMIDNDSMSLIATTLKSYSDGRGLFVILPMMDVSELNQVTPVNIIAMDLSVLQTAAKRYDTDSILILRVLQTLQGYKTQAKLVLNDAALDFNHEGKTIPDVLKQLVDSVTNHLSSRFSTLVSHAVQTSMTITVIGIGQQSDFQSVMNYLSRLTPVAEVEPKQINIDSAVLEISLRTTKESFLSELSEGQKLVVEPDSNQTIFKWRP